MTAAPLGISFGGAPVTVRSAAPADRGAVLELLSASLGWVPDELSSRYFTWKHEENPAGVSPAWVAVADDRILGFRTFLRWQLEQPHGPDLSAVRAVDTATHPDAAGQGIFRRLTLHGLDAMRAEGVDLVFNTPNAQSRAGYLTMGWSDVGRLPAGVRPAGIRSLGRMLRARVPAERWSSLSEAGEPVAAVLADTGVGVLLASVAPAVRIRTRLTVDHLRWRYGFDRLAYRAIVLGGDPKRGLAVFRVRGRGSATEAVLCELVVPDGDRSAGRALQRELARQTGADYVIRLGGPAVDAAGFVRLPGQGPRLVWQGLAPGAGPPPLSGVEMSLGDIELF